MTLRLISAAVAFVSLVVWLFGGPNLGWTKTSIARESVDPVTGLGYITWEKTFLPGVDFLAASEAAAGILFGLSFLSRTIALNAKTKTDSNRP